MTLFMLLTTSSGRGVAEDTRVELERSCRRETLKCVRLQTRYQGTDAIVRVGYAPRNTYPTPGNTYPTSIGRDGDILRRDKSCAPLDKLRHEKYLRACFLE